MCRAKLLFGNALLSLREAQPILFSEAQQRQQLRVLKTKKMAP
jgi:hypothetical protein